MPVAASEGALCRRRAGKHCGPCRAGCVGELLRPPPAARACSAGVRASATGHAALAAWASSAAGG